jgi:alpha-amylase/alpha-mannosidase (GH57 family)
VTDRFVCIHGHFYQPPRENPWLETVEVQDSAYPYHDWNERVTAESYAPNAASRILDADGRIRDIVNNYAQISFNFGPTLLAWLELHALDVYQAILDADLISQERYGGHGSAIAQAYGHLIMPLANERDQRTQVYWGLVDFEERFGRRPEGMWLPETAVDLASLEALAEHEIRYTILAPNQAARVRRIGAREWLDVSDGRIDPTRPYQVNLPSGRQISVFFYDGPVSRTIAFEDLLDNGERFAQRLLDLFNPGGTTPQLVNIATDGETYGHHHRYGEMALSFALRSIEQSGRARLANYGEFLERFPPTHEVEVIEDTSWSCAHGVERWRRDCGCSTGGKPGWNQAWRAPLRTALDWLRDELTPRWERLAAEQLYDPWRARDDYIRVVLDRSEGTVDRFLAEHARVESPDASATTSLKLLELQRHAMLMYASCGWFFNDLAGIETIQVLQYAGRAIQLAEELFDEPLTPGFLDRLRLAESNDPRHGDGAMIYERFVAPAQVSLTQVAAQYAVNTLFDGQEASSRLYCFQTNRQAFTRSDAGRSRLVVGQVRLRSDITHEQDCFDFAALHLGEHNLVSGAQPSRGEEQYQRLQNDLTGAFHRGEIPGTLRLMDQHFDGRLGSLAALFRDDQRRIVDTILDATLADAEAHYRRVYEDNAALIRYLTGAQIPIPRALLTAAEFVMDVDIAREFEDPHFDLGYVRRYFEETASWDLHLDVPRLGFLLGNAINRLARLLTVSPPSTPLIERLIAVIELADWLPFNVDLWSAQNDFYDALRISYPTMKRQAEAGNEDAEAWVGSMKQLGNLLSVAVG